MLISFTCEKCGRRYRVEETKIGQTATCKDCGATMRVPVPGPKIEETPAGGTIYRHREREREFEFAIGDNDNIEAISNHIRQHVGEVSQVYHEMISDLVHIDVHEVPPSEDRPFWTLVTSGMSDRPMHVPEGAECFEYAELALCLPAEWPLSMDDFKDERNYWPVRLLKGLARLPHEYDTWLGIGHTVPNGGEDPTPYGENTRFCCGLLMPPFVRLPTEFAELHTESGRVINFHMVWPLYAEEVSFKLNHGLDALVSRFEKYQVSELIDVTRPNTCAKRPWWKLW